MTLLITVFAAIISTVVWYVPDSNMKLGMLSLIWLVDAFVEYIEIGADILHLSRFVGHGIGTYYMA